MRLVLFLFFFNPKNPSFCFFLNTGHCGVVLNTVFVRFVFFFVCVGVCMLCRYVNVEACPSGRFSPKQLNPGSPGLSAA